MAAIPAASHFLEGGSRPGSPGEWRRRFAGALLIHQGAYVREKIFPIDINEKIEYKMAAWFNQHMSGRRVFAPGSAAIWMNVWSDVPQWGGCCDQSTVSSVDRTGQYYVRAGGKGEWFAGQWATIWLRAYGVYAVGISGPRGRTHYRYFERPHLFDGVLTEVWRDGDDLILPLHHRSGAMARVVEAGDIVRKAPRTGDDLEQVAAYVVALENPRLPLAEAEWRNGHTLVSRAVRYPGMYLSYHVTYHPGWRPRPTARRSKSGGTHWDRSISSRGVRESATWNWFSAMGGSRRRLVRRQEEALWRCCWPARRSCGRRRGQSGPPAPGIVGRRLQPLGFGDVHPGALARALQHLFEQDHAASRPRRSDTRPAPTGPRSSRRSAGTPACARRRSLRCGRRAGRRSAAASGISSDGSLTMS